MGDLKGLQLGYDMVKAIAIGRVVPLKDRLSGKSTVSGLILGSLGGTLANLDPSRDNGSGSNRLPITMTLVTPVPLCPTGVLLCPIPRRFIPRNSISWRSGPRPWASSPC